MKQVFLIIICSLFGVDSIQADCCLGGRWAARRAARQEMRMARREARGYGCAGEAYGCAGEVRSHGCAGVERSHGCAGYAAPSCAGQPAAPPVCDTCPVVAPAPVPVGVIYYQAPCTGPNCPVIVRPQTSVQPVQGDLLAIELNVINRTNENRARWGRRPLLADWGLMRSARRHAMWMARNQRMQHAGGVPENIAMGQRSSSEALQTWMNSSGHRANILNAGYTRMGAAAYLANSGQIFWVQQFLR
jgi:hypothetical protein